jgi:dipeptidyl aminopeptidase/acylaminoacyl peptidase
MNFSKLPLTAALALACATTTSAFGQSALPPIEAFGRIPAMADPVLSPDGKHVAAIQDDGGRTAAVVYTIDGSGTKPIEIPSPDWNIQLLQWAKNDRLLIYLGKTVRAHYDSGIRPWGRLLAVSQDGTNPVVLFHNIPSFGNNVDISAVTDIDLDDPTHIYLPLMTGGYGVFKPDLYKVDVQTGDAEKVMNSEPETTGWLMDGHGGVVARMDQNSDTLEEHLNINQDGSWKDGDSFDGTADHNSGIQGLDQDGKSLVMKVYDGSSRAILVKRDLLGGAETPIFSDPKYDIAGAIFDEWTGRVIGAAYDADSAQYVYFDAAHAAVQKGLKAAFPGSFVNMVSTDRTMNKVIVETSGPAQPPRFYLLDRTTHQAIILGDTYPDLHPADLGDKKPYPYVARDGLPIPAYITLPPGRTAKNLPAIVLPHGGPDARDDMDFDWLSQFLANRGYVVLQPNFRGSSGYGHKYTEAGLHQWGLKIQDDVTDGVKKMIADGIVDPKRVCIFGWSFGGYVALAGAAFTPDLYACAVSMAGVSDLPIILGNEREDSGERSGGLSFWESRIGDPTTDTPRIEATSPARFADKVKCPVLLIHGEGDLTVRINQSEIMQRSLEKAGKTVEFVRIQGDDHYLLHSDTRIQLLTAVERFLRASIGS